MSRDYTRAAVNFTVYAVAALSTDAHGSREAYERETGELWDRIHTALEGIPGVFCEGGGAGLMDAADVIAGSPLDKALRAEQEPTGGEG